MTRKVVILQGEEARAAIRQINLAKQLKPMTLDEGADIYIRWLKKASGRISGIQYSQYLRSFVEEMGDIHLSRVNEVHIGDWVNVPGTKLATRRFKLSVIRSFFRYLSARDLLNYPDPSRIVRIDYSTMSHEDKEYRSPIPFSDPEFRQVLSWIEAQLLDTAQQAENMTGQAKLRKLNAKYARLHFWKLAVVIGRCAGIRLGDICQLEWACFDPVFTVWTDKRNKRVQPAILDKELWTNTFGNIPHTGQYCFPLERNVYLEERTRPNLSFQFKRMCIHAGLPDHTFHGLRHAYATECKRAGVDTPHIARSMGHSRESTTQIYVH